MKLEFLRLVTTVAAMLLTLLSAAASGQTVNRAKASNIKTAHPGLVLWSNQQGEWSDLPVFPEKGGQMKVVNGNPKTGASDILIRFPAGFGVPWHWHPRAEHVYLQAGTLEAQMASSSETLTISSPAFAQVRPRLGHKVKCVSKEDCYLFVHSDGPFIIHLGKNSGK